MSKWFGNWLGNWFGSSEPAAEGDMAGSAAIAITATGGMVGIGALSGAASFSIGATGTAGDEADLAGSAAFSIGAMGSLSGVAWSSGVATLSIGAVGTASGGEEPTTTNPWGVSWGNAWGDSWGAFTTPFQNLDFSKQLFVRSVLNTLYAKSVAEQIVAYASTENISVLEAMHAVTVSTKQTSITVTRRAKLSVKGVQADTSQPRHRESPDKLDGAAYAISRRCDLTVWTGVDEMTVLGVTTSMTLKTQLTGESITRKWVRSAIKSSN